MPPSTDPHFDILMDDFNERTHLRADRDGQTLVQPVSTADEPGTVFSMTPTTTFHAWFLAVLLGFFVEFVCLFVMW